MCSTSLCLPLKGTLSTWHRSSSEENRFLLGFASERLTLHLFFQAIQRCLFLPVQQSSFISEVVLARCLQTLHRLQDLPL